MFYDLKHLPLRIIESYQVSRLDQVNSYFKLNQNIFLRRDLSETLPKNLPGRLFLDQGWFARDREGIFLEISTRNALYRRQNGIEPELLSDIDVAPAPSARIVNRAPDDLFRWTSRSLSATLYRDLDRRFAYRLIVASISALFIRACVCWVSKSPESSTKSTETVLSSYSFN